MTRLALVVAGIFGAVVAVLVQDRGEKRRRLVELVSRSCAPLQTCQVLEGPRERLVLNAHSKIREAPADWRLKYSADNVLRMAQLSQEEAETRPTIKREFKSVSDFASQKNFVFATVVDASCAEIILPELAFQFTDDSLFVIALDDKAVLAAQRNGVPYLPDVHPIRKSDPWLEMQLLKKEGTKYYEPIRGTGGTADALPKRYYGHHDEVRHTFNKETEDEYIHTNFITPRSRILRGHYRLAGDLAQLVAINKLERFLVFEANTFFIGDPRHLLPSGNTIRLAVKSTPGNTLLPNGKVKPSAAVVGLSGIKTAKSWAPAFLRMSQKENIISFEEHALPKGYTIYDARIVISSEMPVVQSVTIAVHLRRGDDNDLYAKKQVERGTSYGGESTTPFSAVARTAKELGIWPGADCYYQPQKYLALEDSVLFTLPPDFHAGERYLLAIFNLLILAKLTHRVAVLPAIINFEKFFYASEYIDFDDSIFSASSIRESTFFRRLHHSSEPKIARIVLRADGSVGTAPSGQASSNWFAPEFQSENHLQKRLLVAVANEDPEASNADILYLDIDATKNDELIFPELSCFFRSTFSAGRLCSSQHKKVEAWLSFFWDHTSFCTTEARGLRFLNLLSPADDCRSKRLEDLRRSQLALIRHHAHA